jgi:dihydropteroate synthase
MTQVYIRPMGVLWGRDADAAVKAGLGGRLGGGRAAFSSMEIVRRDGREINRERCTYSEIAGSRDAQLKARLAHIESPRAALGGLAMNRPSIMGIVNVTPDSFSDGGEAANTVDAVALGMKLASDGADIIDIGGESTRPGSDGITIEEEGRRVLPVVRELSTQGLKVSIDTRKPQIMRAAVEAGAVMINDVSALRFDVESLTTVVKLKKPVCLMHAQGDPKTMQVNPVYEDVVLDVFDELELLIDKAVSEGLPRSLILADPGIGFGKTYRHNLDLLQSLALFHGLGTALMVGASRKAFIGALTAEKTPKERLFGSLGAALAAAAQGVHVLRVHDVRATVQALTVWRAAVEPEAASL